jgi:D-lactate dehydrogenase
VIRLLPANASALLVEFQSADEKSVGENAAKAKAAVATLKLLFKAEFSSDPEEHDRLWSIRKGLFPSVGAVGHARVALCLLTDGAVSLG